MSTALFIDTFTRELRVSTVSVSQATSGLVLRFGADLGPLWLLVKERELQPELPIIVPTRGYEALSSAGFTMVAGNGDQRATVIGIQGMPWMKGTKSLRPLSRPFDVYLFRPGTNLRRVETQQGLRLPKGSNPNAAEAALAGLKIRARALRETFIIEGQSDYVLGYELAQFYRLREEPWSPEWPVEHRGDVFSPYSMAKKIFLRQERDRLNEDGEVGALLRLAIQGMGAVRLESDHPVLSNLLRESGEQIAEEVLRDLLGSAISKPALLPEIDKAAIELAAKETKRVVFDPFNDYSPMVVIQAAAADLKKRLAALPEPEAPEPQAQINERVFDPFVEEE